MIPRMYISVFKIMQRIFVLYSGFLLNFSLFSFWFFEFLNDITLPFVKWLVFFFVFKLSVKNCFIRGSVVRYVQLPADECDTQLLQDAARKEAAQNKQRWWFLANNLPFCFSSTFHLVHMYIAAHLWQQQAENNTK